MDVVGFFGVYFDDIVNVQFVVFCYEFNIRVVFIVVEDGYFDFLIFEGFSVYIK